MSSITQSHPIEHILPLLNGYKPLQNGRGYTACCPAHNDKSPSLTIWEDGTDRAGIHCFAGCSQNAVLAALNLTWHDLYRDGQEVKPTAGITMVDLAIDKHVNPHILDFLGITDGHIDKGKRSVHIPYYTADGKPYERYRIRTALKATDGSHWNQGEAPIIPYGLERLADTRNAGYQVIVEGESDCWTNWTHGLPALGIPGIDLFSKIKPEYLEGLGRVYIIQEPPSEDDKQKRRDPGKAFVEKTYKHLLTIGYQGKVYAVNLYEQYGVKDPNELHKLDPQAFKVNFEQALKAARLLSPALVLPETSEACDLMNENIPPLRWIVQDVIPEGMTLLGGKQKIGKSWFILALALALAFGGVFLNTLKVERCEVLYLALEDNKRRLQDRIAKLIPLGIKLPKGFHYALKWPRLNDEGLRLLELWLNEHPQVKLVIIDTWGRAKPIVKGQNGYDADVEAASGVQSLAMERNISILAVCHVRKASAEDVVDELNATTGLSATADNILILKRVRGSDEGSLFGTGREIELDKALSYNDGNWKLLGDGAEYRLSQESKEVIDTLNINGAPMWPKDLAAVLQVSENTMRKRLFGMKKRAEILETKQGYISNIGNGGNTGNGGNGGNGGNTHLYETIPPAETPLPRYQSPKSVVTPMNGHYKPFEGHSVTSVTSVTTIPDFACKFCNIVSWMWSRDDEDYICKRCFSPAHKEVTL